MALILNIETATAVCSICLSDGEKILGIRETTEHNSHSKVVAVFIDELLKETGTDKRKLDAVAVSKGPGSYTGLRIGVSTAKGLCYALDIPLIGVGTLEAMGFGMKLRLVDEKKNLPLLYVPMIDARRMEVYTALFDENLRPLRDTTAEIITRESFSDLLTDHHLVVAGDGAGKCRTLLVHPNLTYLDDFGASAFFMTTPANLQFEAGHFENTAYFEPFYLKDFIAGKPRVKGLH
ncbi:MAG: tRNA (adenosine(37)-N6)-threonylcarbamoyltransferase complex dimerization subunit type 1 TsaB [Bacteroidota bacterium]